MSTALRHCNLGWQDDNTSVSGNNPAILSAHLDQLDSCGDVQEQEECKWQDGGEDGVQIHVVDFVVVDILS